MFCGSIFLIWGLVVLALQGQTTRAASHKDMTCGDISVTLNMTWNATYENKTSQLFKDFSSSVNNSIYDLFNDSSKYTAVKVAELKFKGTIEEVNVTFSLCLVQNTSYNGFIEDVFKNQIKTGSLFAKPVFEGSFEFKTSGVIFSWIVKDGECGSKCPREGDGCERFVIEQKCEAEKYSCTGVKLASSSSTDCVKYCNSTIQDAVKSVTDWKPRDDECTKCSEESCGPFAVERECIPKTGCSCDGMELTKNSTDCLKHCNHSSAGVTFSDWEPKKGECDKCSKGGGGPFILERKCTPKGECSCDGLELTQNSTNCVKHCDHSSAVVTRISSIILAVGIILPFSFNTWK